MMQRKAPCILVADSGAAQRDMRAAIGSDAELINVHTLEDAVRKLQDVDIQLIVVGYHFDELRPFRLIRHAREQFGRKAVPILLLRALPVHLGATSEVQLREAYRSLGVNAFFNFHEEAQNVAYPAALEKFRRALRDLLRL